MMWPEFVQYDGVQLLNTWWAIWLVSIYSCVQPGKDITLLTECTMLRVRSGERGHGLHSSLSNWCHQQGEGLRARAKAIRQISLGLTSRRCIQSLVSYQLTPHR